MKTLILGRFMGMELTTVTDYLIAYAACIAVIVVGLILLSILNKSLKPLQPEQIEKSGNACRERLEGIIEDIRSTERYSVRKLSAKLVSLQFELDKIVYAATVIIEEKKDITFEGVRGKYVAAIEILDRLNVFTAKKEETLVELEQTLSLLKEAETLTANITKRYKNFGK